MRKILLFTRPIVPPWDEASKNLAWDLARNVREDFEFHLLTDRNFAKKMVTENGNLVAHPIFSSHRFNTLAKMKMLFWFFFNRLDFDIIHLPFTPRSLTSFLIRLRLKFFKGKTVQTVAAATEINDKIFFADKIIAQSKHTAERLKKANIQNVEAIYPGIDLELYQPAQKDALLMEELGIKPDDFILTYTGEYTKIPGIDIVFSTFEKLNNQKSTDKNWKLLLALRIKSPADEEKKRKLSQQAKKGKYADQVIHIADYQEKLSKKMGKFMSQLYNSSHLTLFPVSHMIGKFDIPYVIIEAMACAKPVIVSNLPILIEHIRDSENGLVVPKDDPEKLTQTIQNLANDPVAIDRIGSNARHYVEDNFNITETAKKYQKVYNEL